MYESIEVVEFFIEIIERMMGREITFNSSLEEMVLSAGRNDLTYVDNRRDIKKMGYDFWEHLRMQFKDDALFKRWLRDNRIDKKFLYSKSEQFPDFLFKVREHEDKLICGSLLELKDSKSGSIASFNSTIPTKQKSLEEINVINGGDLVSRIAKILDGELALAKDYYTFQRRSFYFVRTHKDNPNKIKISIVDGSFFETIPKEHLINQMFLNVLRAQLAKRKIELPPERLKEVEETISCITDQNIIASSQIIEKASVRPRLRIMAEVHPEGNPHISFYPQILEGGFNLIRQASPSVKELKEKVLQKLPEIKIFSIRHKRNGEHVVFQFKPA
ncbi:MAG: hypothetical protein EF807_00185 [Candidatus Methanolliviera hydrocarbonicum]|uniref:Uncharacterized protein n=1 Tax=Candidatus Methanolliviera hydrocarbonicum TaxID=2491085 RepID=A0A520KZ73_9EURY|nr:MAG: hypothetical protein EF807_00185 [Candidatus Methanolliviera hydrocarbonicum]